MPLIILTWAWFSLQMTSRRFFFVFLDQLTLFFRKYLLPFFDHDSGLVYKGYITLNKFTFCRFSRHQKQVFVIDQLFRSNIGLASLTVSENKKFPEQELALKPFVAFWFVKITINSKSLPHWRLQGIFLFCCVKMFIYLLFQWSSKPLLIILEPYCNVPVVIRVS